MSTYGFIEYDKATPEVRAVYDDIMATRKIDKVTNFWKALAHDPVRLKRTWEDTKEIMAAGALDSLVKELIYVAVSVTNQCDYCIAAHTAAARKKGMTEAMFNEMLAVVGLANQNNRLVAGHQAARDPAEQSRTCDHKDRQLFQNQQQYPSAEDDQRSGREKFHPDVARNVAEPEMHPGSHQGRRRHCGDRGGHRDLQVAAVEQDERCVEQHLYAKPNHRSDAAADNSHNQAGAHRRPLRQCP